MVERVVDGDTIIVAGVGRVRLIGVDTPESVNPRRPVEFFGEEASAFTKQMLEGREVRLECAEARAHDITPVRRGHPAYEHMRDGNGDGVICE